MNFKGQMLRTMKAGVVRLTETVAQRNAVFGSHRHEHAYLSCLLAGAYREAVDGLEQEFSLGAVIWHAAGEVHCNRFGAEGGHLLNLEVDCEAARALEPELAVARPREVFRSGPVFAAGLALFRALNGAGETAEERSWELLALLLRESARPLRPAWLRSALEFVEDRFDGSLRLKDVAREFGVHPVHVARAFREGLSCTMREVLCQVRVRRACDLLCEPRWNIAEVAAQCGFSDHAHLCRTFKRITGLTPSSYRTHVSVNPAKVNPVQAMRPAPW